MWFLQACIIGACLVYTLRKTGIRIQLLIGIVLFAFALICNNYYSVSQAIGISDFIDSCSSARETVYFMDTVF